MFYLQGFLQISFLLFSYLFFPPLTYQNGPAGLVIAGATDFGLLYFMAVDPTSQLVHQPDK